MKNKMEARKIVDSFYFALEGIQQALQSERNLKIHVFLGALALVLALFLEFSRLEMVILLLAVVLVLTMELFNTVVERIIDLICPNYHPRARFIKNVAAGAVLVAAFNSAIVGFLLFYPRLDGFSLEIFSWLREQPAHLTFLVLIIILVLVLFLKHKKGAAFGLQGGMPSFHSALAFGLATAGSFLTENSFLVLLFFFLAFLIAQSRVEGKIHRFSEVFWGGFLGAVVAILIFQFLAGGTV